MSDRVNIPTTVKDPNYRYKMDALKVSQVGRDNKTVIQNLSTICKTLNVPHQWVCKFLSFNLGTTEDWHEDQAQLYLNGTIQDELLRKVLDKFINAYVTCAKCRVPELTYLFSGADDSLDMNCKCRACSYQFKLNLVDKKMKNVISQFPPTGIHETMVKAEETVKEKKKDKEKVIAKISDQNYLIGSKELNNIVMQARINFVDFTKENDVFKQVEQIADLQSTTISKNEFLKAQVLWNSVIEVKTFKFKFFDKLKLIKAIMRKQKNIPRFQTYLTVSFLQWCSWKETKVIPDKEICTLAIEMQRMNILTYCNFEQLLNFKQETGEKVENDLKLNWKKKQVKRGLERLQEFIEWLISEEIELVDVPLEDEKDMQLDKNESLKLQSDNIKKISEDLRKREDEMRLKQQEQVQQGEKLDINQPAEEEVDIDDI